MPFNEEGTLIVDQEIDSSEAFQYLHGNGTLGGSQLPLPNVGLSSHAESKLECMSQKNGNWEQRAIRKSFSYIC